jgi:hypothetical protein
MTQKVQRDQQNKNKKHERRFRCEMKHLQITVIVVMKVIISAAVVVMVMVIPQNPVVARLILELWFGHFS